MKKVLMLSATLMLATFAIQPASAASWSETCIASWYGPGFQGNTMANGQKFDMNDPTTVAHKKLPFGTRLRITNLVNGKSIIAVVRDRGPFISGRCIDGSKAVAIQLDYHNAGTTQVKVEAL